ncbi:hypothetical protein M3Y99_01680400 [Aphelenchoides fujianensis]|nr:hypothetical protein M3Y99_01680400 [Aphelenchoides fujianensis]
MKLLVLLLAVHFVLFVECVVRSPRSHARLGRRHHEREASERHDGWRRGARHDSTREGEEETNKWGLDGRREGKTAHKHWNHSAGDEHESKEQFHRNQTTAEWGAEGAQSAESTDRRGGPIGGTHRGHKNDDRQGRGGHTRPDHRSGHEHRHHDGEERIPGGHGPVIPDKHAGEEDRSKTHKDGHQRPHGSRGHRHTHDEVRPGAHHPHDDEQGRGTFTGPQGARGHEQEPKDQEATSPAPLGQEVGEKKPAICDQKDEKPAGLGQKVEQPEGEHPLGQEVDEKDGGRTEETGGLSGGFGFGWAFGHGLQGGKFNPALYCEISRPTKCFAIQQELCPGSGQDVALTRECIRSYCASPEARCRMLRKMAAGCNGDAAKRNILYAREACS